MRESKILSYNNFFIMEVIIMLQIHDGVFGGTLTIEKCLSKSFRGPVLVTLVNQMMGRCNYENCDF